MTSNQLKRLELMENHRANLAKEAETNRSNLAKEKNDRRRTSLETANTILNLVESPSRQLGNISKGLSGAVKLVSLF